MILERKKSSKSSFLPQIILSINSSNNQTIVTYCFRKTSGVQPMVEDGLNDLNALLSVGPLTYIYLIVNTIMGNHDFLYIIRSGSEIKIGVSDNPEGRLKHLQTGNQQDLTLEYTEERKYAYKLEKYLHQKFSLHHIRGEWFDGTKITLNDIRRTTIMFTEYDWA